MKKDKYKLFNLTPIDTFGYIFVKRDDYYKPFKDSDVVGGKVRQCISLIESNLDLIKKEYNSTVATASSVHSPQGIIVSRVAKEFGLKSILAIGGPKELEETISHHKNLQIAKSLGCDIKLVTKMPYNNVLYSKLNNLEEQYGSFFKVLFGMNIDNNPESIIGVTANQVLNIPKDLDNLVIPVGSGISAGGILAGLIKYNIKPKNIYMVQIAGYDRTMDINNITQKYINVKIDSIDTRYGVNLSNGWKYNFIRYNKYPYTKWLKIPELEYSLDGRYESKAWDWMINNIDYKNEKTLFWIIGNSYSVIF